MKKKHFSNIYSWVIIPIAGRQNTIVHPGTEDAMKKAGGYRYIICACSTGLMFMNMGLLSTAFSAYFPYIQETLHFTNTQLCLLPTIRLISTIFFTLFTDAYYRRLGIKKGCLGALLGTAFGFCLLGFAESFLWYEVCMVLFGFSYAMGTMIPASLLVRQTVLVLDEAQDMDPDAFNLVKAIMKRNEDMRVIAVGDDDQNIYEFNNADSGHMRSLITEYGARQYELLDNYRSARSVVAFANSFASSIRNRMKSHPIAPVKNDAGTTVLCKFNTPNMETATLSLIKKTYKGGSCGVLTRTNAEALQMVGILKKNGYRARLIQSNDGFNLFNLYEIRTFVNMLGDADKMPVIPQDVWDDTVERFNKMFQNSGCLHECLSLLQTFDKTTPKKYMSDLVEFIRESKFEDFIATGGDEILVSTVHKSKGREFDTVYLMLNRYLFQNDADRRVFYVGFTRAKQNLYICYNNSVFDSIDAPSCQHVDDPTSYPEFDELIEQLGHRGVNLGYFQDKQQRICQMYSGAPLILDGDYLQYDFNRYKARVLRFSNAVRTDFEKHITNGYLPVDAKVRFLVYWKPSDQPDAVETLIALPEVKFRKNMQGCH